MNKARVTRKLMFAGRVLTLLCCLTVSLIAAEYVARFFFDTRSPFEQKFPVEEYRVPRPYVMFSGQPGAAELNSLGYRGPAPTARKVDGEFRIAMLGGSTMVNGAPTIAELLESKLRAAGKKHVKVYNFGVVSSVSAMETTKILTEVSDYQPDLIIMYNGGNDIIQPYFWDPRPGYPFNFVMIESNPLGRPLAEYPVLTLTALGSALLRKAFYNHFVEAFTLLSDLRTRVGYQTEKWVTEIANCYADNLRKAKTVSNAFGAEFCAFFQPLVFYKSTLAEQEIGLVSDKDFQRYCTRQRELLRHNQAWLSAAGVTVHDLSDVFDNNHTAVFTDYIHVTQEGNEVVAEAMVAPVLQLVKDLEEQRAK